MARIRTIKPEFFTSFDIVSMSPLARLFYVSLWCESDRDGKLKWDKKTLKMRYLPSDDCDIDTLANELTKNGLIILYEIEDKQYAEIPSFKAHQVINNRESVSIIPSRVKVACTRESEEGKEGREGKGREPASDTHEKNKTPLKMLTDLDVPEKVAKDWLLVRKAKRAPLTETALNELVVEAGKAGITTAQAVEICAKKSWQGFNASWNFKDALTVQSGQFNIDEWMKTK